MDTDGRFRFGEVTGAGYAPAGIVTARRIGRPLDRVAS